MVNKIYIGFSKPKSWFQPFAWSIRQWEGTSYSHAYIRIPSKFLDTDVVYQSSGLSVNFVSIDTFCHHNVRIKEFEFEISDSTLQTLLKSALQNLGKPYSIRGIAGIVAARVMQILSVDYSKYKNPFTDGRAAYVCSELVGQVLIEFLGAHIEQDLDLVTPLDIERVLPSIGKEIAV